jgi:hypothetical protein
MWRNGGTALPILTSALDGGERLASCLSCFTPRETVPGTLCIRGWVGPRAVFDAVEKTEICTYQELNPSCPACSPSLYCLSYPGSCQIYTSYIHYSLGPCNLRGLQIPRTKFTHKTTQNSLVKLRSCMAGITVDNKLVCSTAPYTAAVRLLQCICAVPHTET